MLAASAILPMTASWALAAPAFLGAWGSYGSGAGQFQSLQGVAVDAEGLVYVVDQTPRVQVFDGVGRFVSQWPISDPLGTAQLNAIAADGLGRIHLLGVTSGGPGVGVQSTYQRYTTAGSYIDEFVLADSRDQTQVGANGVAASPDGQSYITESGEQYYGPGPGTPIAQVVHYSASGSGGFWGSAGSGTGQMALPFGVALDGFGFVYVADPANHRVEKFTTDGTFITQWGSSGSGDGQFAYAWAIAVGPNGHVYVTDAVSDRIQEFTDAGAFVSVWGSFGSGPGQFNGPVGIAIDGDGNVYVADYGNYRIQKFGSGAVPVSHTSWGRIKAIYR